MKRNVYMMVLLTVVSMSSYGRNIPDDSLSLPVLITGNTGETGTGFYLATTTSWFLVTAKHVVYREDNTTLKMESVTLLSYPNGRRDYDQRIEYRIDLRLAASNNLIRASSSHDVVTVWLGNSQTNMLGQSEIVWSGPLTVRTTTNLNQIVTSGLQNLQSYTNTVDGNDAYVFGYPSSIGLRQIPQIDYNLPLLRKGVIAGKHPSRKTIILDAPVYYGNSGGPAMEVEHLDAFTTKYLIIGVVSQFVPFAEEWENKKHKYYNVTISNSGYAVVEPTDVIMELIW